MHDTFIVYDIWYLVSGRIYLILLIFKAYYITETSVRV